MNTSTFVKTLGVALVLNLQLVSGAFSQSKAGFFENFDSLTPPTLPAGWQSVSLDGSTQAVNSNTTFFSNPNSAFLPNPDTVSDLALVTTPISFDSGSDTYDAKVEFEHKRGFEDNFDLGVLEVSINGGPFKDFKDPSFHVTDIDGDYNHTLNNPSNPLHGRAGWNGNSATFEYVSFTMNDVPNDSSLRFRFRIGTDDKVGAPGWFVDDFTVTPLIDASCKIEPFNSDILAGQTASFTISIINPSSVGVPPSDGLIIPYSGYSVENISFMPGTESSPFTFLPLPGGSFYSISDSGLVPPNSTKKFKIDLNTTNPPRASAKVTLNNVGDPFINGAEVGLNFLPSSENLPEEGLMNAKVFPAIAQDFCSPLLQPLPTGFSGSIVVNFQSTTCSVGQAALNAQGAGAIAYIGITNSAFATDPLNPPPSYHVEPATAGLKIPVFPLDEFNYYRFFSFLGFTFNPAFRISIEGSNDPHNSTLVISFQFTGNESKKAGNNLCVGTVNLATDQDGDGTLDSLDECPTDPAKSSAGVCGCGVADIDANSNGIVDCQTDLEAEASKNLFTSELRNKISSLLKNFQKIRKKKFKKQKKLRKTSKALLVEIVTLSANTDGILVTSSSIDLSTLTSNLNKSGKKYLSKLKTFAKNKKKARKDINALLAAIVSA